jgi:soluble lytic murein transglycosylase
MKGSLRAASASLVILLSSVSAFAQSALPELAPLPFSRPQPSSGLSAIDNAMATGSVSAFSAAGMAADLLAGDPSTLLRSGLDAIASGEIGAARGIRDAIKADTVERRVLTWAIASSGGADLSSTEIAAAIEELSDWPGLDALRANMERALNREDAGPRAVLAAMGDRPPQTAEGVMILARARLAMGQVDAARMVLSPFWRTQKLSAREELAILREFGGLIPAFDHRFRMERMLYNDRAASAERVAALADSRELARAFIAVARNERNAEELLKLVPKGQRSAAYTFAHARHLRRTGKYKQAAAVMLSAPTDASLLVDPDAWWIERRVLSRELLDLGDPATAYKLAAAHAAESPVHAVDAEFHAGWYALRSLDDAEAGARHFARIAEIADGPISLSRAYYWLGRAAEAGGPGDAGTYYERAAAFGTAFYGQLAAAKLGRRTLLAEPPSPSETDRRTFEGREAVKAIRRLDATGHGHRTSELYRALAQELESTGEISLLAGMAESQGNYFLALRIGKWASSRGLDVGGLTHPVGAIPATAEIASPGKALAYAIARQESEFNAGARSGAGALGLLQLLPGTAREMARKAGLNYTQARLTSDPGYNATLGARYLDEQLGRFAGSYVLTFAGYNAGPRRAQEWVERYGDPRGKDIDTVVDWIERIPFHETRSYVQRVMENYQVYKMRLSGQMEIATDLVSGRAR